MKLYRTRTQAEYDWLARELSKKGMVSYIPRHEQGGDIVVYADEKEDYLSYSDLDYAEKECPNEPIIEVSDLMDTVDHDTLMQKVMGRNNKPETLKELTEPLDLIDSHKRICKQLNKVYADKNHDYGNSFGETYEKYGDISALVRISDKMNRIDQLVQTGEQKVKDEALEDSVLDMANYLIMWAMELEETE